MIDRIRRALGISCVEIYLLALFERHNVDRNEVFTESYIPLHRLISDFTENVQTNFASYAGLERVQSIAARKKMAEFSNLPCKKNTAFQYYMYRVKPEYKNAEASFGAHDVFIYMQKQKNKEFRFMRKKERTVGYEKDHFQNRSGRSRSCNALRYGDHLLCKPIPRNHQSDR